MLEEIKKDLADNFQVGDEEVLRQYIDETTTDALSISNRKKTTDNIRLLESDIKKCVKSKYLLPFLERDVSDLSDYLKILPLYRN